MKIKDGFVLEKVGGSYLACATGSLAAEFSGLVRMNETGVFLWNLISDGGCSREELIDNMVKEYEIDYDIAAKDIDAFISNLRSNGIIEE